MGPSSARIGRLKFFSRSAIVLAMTIVAVTGFPTTAQAHVNCPHIHCYSVMSGANTTFYGIYGSWGRANMFVINPIFNVHVNATIWFSPHYGNNNWAEVGHVNGVNPTIGAQAYSAYWAYHTAGVGFVQGWFANISPNPNVTDEFQISRGGAANVWNIYWNGVLKVTPNLGFWSGTAPQVGGEFAGTQNYTFHADTFNMYTKAINGAGQRVNWGPVTYILIPAPPNHIMNGVNSANGVWHWNTIN